MTHLTLNLNFSLENDEERENLKCAVYQALQHASGGPKVADKAIVDAPGHQGNWFVCVHVNEDQEIYLPK